MPVHMFGHPADMPRLMEIARRHDLKVIEDAAEAHGAEVGGRRVGGIGDLSTFSFYANKIVTTGEGGMVLTSDADLAGRLRSLRNLCFIPGRRFYHTELGHNYRLPTFKRRSALPNWSGSTITWRTSAGWPRDIRRGWKISGNCGCRSKSLDTHGLLDVQHGTERRRSVRCGRVRGRLQKAGVMTRPLFLGMHEQPVFHARGLHVGEHYPVTERLARRGLYVPSGLTLTLEQIDTVSAAVRTVLS